MVVAHAEQMANRSDVSFYQLDPRKSGCKPIGKLENVAASAQYWNPRGRYICLAGLGELNGQLMFFDVDRFLSLKDEVFILSFLLRCWFDRIK